MSLFSNNGCNECGLFGGDDTILWFIILFLLIFYCDCGCGRGSNSGCNDCC